MREENQLRSRSTKLVSALDTSAWDFRRLDEDDDSVFYSVPRRVVHIDDDAIAALTQLYAALVPPPVPQAARRGITQYVVVGAGLDTFAFRQPDWARRLKIVEIDHPASQQFKIASLKSAGIVRTVANGYLSRSHATITATPVTVQAKPAESRTAKSDPREPTR